MSRIKGGVTTRQRHKRLLKQTKGFWGIRKNAFRKAKETLLRAMAYAFVGRKHRKRDFRSLFITRINAAVRPLGLSYSTFIHKLKLKNIELNRKMLGQLAVLDSQTFDAIVNFAKA